MDIKSEYINIVDYRKILVNAKDYYHLVLYNPSLGAITNVNSKDTLKLLAYNSVYDMGIIFSDFMKDFGGRKKCRKAVYDSINEIYGDMEIVGHYDELENCRRHATLGTGYWDVPYILIPRLKKKDREIKYLEIGPGAGVMSLSLEKLMDIDVTWLNIPHEEKLWGEIRGTTMLSLINKYGITIQEGYIETDDFSSLNSCYDVVVLTQVMEHFIYNPVGTLKKIKNFIKEDGYVFVSYPEEIQRNFVEHYSEMPYPEDLSGGQRQRREQINEYHHFREYTTEEAMEIFNEAGLECVNHTWTYPIHHFMLKKKDN